MSAAAAKSTKAVKKSPKSSPAAKVPARAPAKKAPAKVATAVSVPRRKPEVKRAPVVVPPPAPPAPAPAPVLLSREERYQLIEREAYFLAEKNGFQGDPSGYWHAAEQKVRKDFPG